MKILDNTLSHHGLSNLFETCNVGTCNQVAFHAVFLGCIVGVIIGVAFTLGQQTFGWIKIPGNMVFESYPVELNASDVVMVAIVVISAGWLISRMTVGAKLRRE